MTDIDKLAREIAFKAVDEQIEPYGYGLHQVQAAARLGILEGMKLQRERDAVLLDGKAAMYRGKASKRDPFADDTMNPHDLSNELAVGMEYAAAAIRSAL